VAVAVQAVLVKHNPPTYAFAYQYAVATEDRVVLTWRGRNRVADLREQIATVSHSDLSPDDLNARLRELAADFRAAIDADLARQDEDIEDRDVVRDTDLG
jgi:hypothetical protein